MSDLEFAVLDELYFIQPFGELMSSTQLEDHELKPILAKLLRKGWVRCYENVNDLVDESDFDFEINFRQYYYLASKEGLLAHNSN